MTTGVSNLETSIDLANLWLKDIMDQLKWESKNSTYKALRATLHVLRDRLQVVRQFSSRHSCLF